jgi:hypothetical protein
VELPNYFQQIILINIIFETLSVITLSGFLYVSGSQPFLSCGTLLTEKILAEHFKSKIKAWGTPTY